MAEKVENVIIMGCGAAAHTAAIYAARASLEPLVIGDAAGSYADDSDCIPGFPQAADKEKLIFTMRQQAERFGARYCSAEKIIVRSAKTPFAVEADGDTFSGHSLILAEGTAQLSIGAAKPTSAGDKGAASNISGIYLCPRAMSTQATLISLAAAEGCQASIETERALQERNVTAPDQKTESW